MPTKYGENHFLSKNIEAGGFETPRELGISELYIMEFCIFSGLDSRTSAACKPQINQPFTILKISWKSKLDPNMAITIFKNKNSNQFKG